jgi:hypothetical protein
LANSVPFTTIPFCLKIDTHNNPANEEENVQLNAPKLLAIAVEKMAPVRIRGSATTWGARWKLGSRRISTRRIVAPIFVPQSGQRTRAVK